MDPYDEPLLRTLADRDEFVVTVTVRDEGNFRAVAVVEGEPSVRAEAVTDDAASAFRGAVTALGDIICRLELAVRLIAAEG